MRSENITKKSIYTDTNDNSSLGNNIMFQYSNDFIKSLKSMYLNLIIKDAFHQCIFFTVELIFCIFYVVAWCRLLHKNCFYAISF